MSWWDRKEKNGKEKKRIWCGRVSSQVGGILSCIRTMEVVGIALH